MIFIDHSAQELENMQFFQMNRNIHQDREYSTNLNKFKRIQIIQNMLSDHNRIKLKIHNTKVTGKAPNTGKVNNILINNL